MATKVLHLSVGDGERAWVGNLSLGSVIGVSSPVVRDRPWAMGSQASMPKTWAQAPGSRMWKPGIGARPTSPPAQIELVF